MPLNKYNCKLDRSKSRSFISRQRVTMLLINSRSIDLKMNILQMNE